MPKDAKIRDGAPEICFVTRKFPPAVGGMETLAAAVWRSLSRSGMNATLYAYAGALRGLLWWIPLTVIAVSWRLLRGHIAVIVAGDALVGAVVRPLAALFRAPVVIMVMGLDITYHRRVYRWCVYPQLRRANKVVAISAATASAAIRAGVAADKVSVLRLGVEVPTAASGNPSAELRAHLNLNGDDLIVASLGRLVPRKGFAWFVRDVLPRLPEQTHYVLAGVGTEQETIAEVAAEVGLSARVHLLGAVSESKRELLMCGADIFVQPNIAVPGDMEGFGLVVVEAAMRNTLTVSADIEGLIDAVMDGETGILLPSGDAAAWHERLTQLLASLDSSRQLGQEFGAVARREFSEELMGRRFVELLKRMY